MPLLIQIVLLIIVLSFALFVQWKGREKPANLCLALFIVVYQISNFASFMSMGSKDAVADLMLVRITVGLAVLLAPIFYLFVDYFPDNKGTLTKIRKYTLFVATFLIVADVISPLMFSSITVDQLTGGISVATGPGIAIFPVFFISVVFLGFKKGIKKFKASSFKTRSQLRIFLISAFVSFALSLVSDFIFPNILKNTQLLGISNITSVIVLSAMVYSIIKHRLFDLYFAVRKITINFISFVVVYCLLIPIAILAAGTEVLHYISMYFIVAFVALFLLIIIPVILDLVGNLVDKYFFKRALSQKRVIHEFFEKLNETIDIHEVYNVTATYLKSLLGLTDVRLISTHDPEYVDITALLRRHKFTTLISVEELPDEEEKSVLRNNKISVIYPLYLKTRKSDLILVLYDKVSNEPFYVEDYALLDECVDRAILAISNASLYSEVVELNKDLKQKVEEATQELVKSNEQLKDKNDELQRAYQEANETARKERDMLDIMGHELRTPATVVKMATYLLDPQVSTENGKKQIERIKDSIERQIKLINTFINTAKIENNKIELALTPVHLDELLKQAIEDHMAEAAEKNLHLYFEDNGQMPYVLADRARIREVIDNFITNAIKYTFEGYVKAWCFIGDREVVVKVEDSGEGIKEDDRQELFQKFKRVNNYTSSSGDTSQKMIRPGGTGLGLYVSKGVVELHKGKIWVDSEYGKGSIFGFSIPIASDEEVAKYQNQNQESANMFNKIRLEGPVSS